MSHTKNTHIKVLYLHGRPSSHPIHQSLAKSLNVTSGFIDEKYRWHDKNYSTLKNIWMWFKNAIHLPIPHRIH